MCNALTVTKRESAPLPERLCERIAYCAILLTVYEADYSVVVAQSEGADHRYYSTPEMQNILLQNVVGHAVRKAKNFAGGATDAIFSGRPVLINYSCSLALRRWSSSRATVTSCPISSAALTPIFSTCASASSEETRGFSPLPSAWRRAISPRMAVTMNPALLSPSSFTDSMPSITSWGTLIVVICDFAFLYTDIVNHQFVMCISLYTKVRYKNTCNVYHHNIMCISHGGRYVSHNERFIKTTKPGSARTLTGLLTKPLNEVTIMAGTQHTQTHPKFIYIFLAVHRDCMADGKNTVHVAADTLVDACKMLNDMGYISATWKGREENTLFIQKCENNFIWRFIALSTAQPRVIHIEATSEQEARQQSPDGCVMVFAARIRQEVEHV